MNATRRTFIVFLAAMPVAACGTILDPTKVGAGRAVIYRYNADEYLIYDTGTPKGQLVYKRLGLNDRSRARLFEQIKPTDVPFLEGQFVGRVDMTAVDFSDESERFMRVPQSAVTGPEAFEAGQGEGGDH